ncbi:T9SS type A sorting domain-containing protein [Crocinitomix catalasitica]|nr:T9SS type A sorting domain-containing protein [Crocinitomix catalasitica]
MKKIYTLLGSFLITGAAIAQSPYAPGTYMDKFDGGKHDGKITFIDMRDKMEGHFDRATYYTENFDGGLGGWTNAIALGVVGFEATSVGHGNDAGSTFIIPNILSSTPTGWVMVDSDSDGSGAAGEELATLTSPVIDLTAGGYTAGPLKFEMEQFYAGWALDTCKVAFSDDSGASWDVVEICNNGLGRESRPNAELISIDISAFIVDPTQVQIQFIWHANWDYGWQLDNVQILDLPTNDLELSRVFRDDYDLAAGIDPNGFSYSMMPQAQARPFVIGARIENIGAATQTNVGFTWEIEDPTSTVVASGTSALVAASVNGQSDTLWVATGFTPSMVGAYNINFTAFADLVDDEPANNAITDNHFELTDYTYATDYGASYGTFYNWVPTPTDAAAIGSMMEIYADGVVGAIWSELDDSPDVVGQLIYYMLYKWDGAAWGYIDETPDYTTVSSDQGAGITLYFDTPINLVAGDIVCPMAAHFGGSPPAGWALTGSLPIGQVLGVDGAGTLTGMSGNWAPKVRMLMLDFTDVEEGAIEEKFDIYPNPATDILNISLTLNNAENTVINVLDISGKVINSRYIGDVIGNSNITLDVADFASGVYFVEVVNADGKQNKKFVKK